VKSDLAEEAVVGGYSALGHQGVVGVEFAEDGVALEATARRGRRRRAVAQVNVNLVHVNSSIVSASMR
jgi:hypothetical protein